MSAGGAKRTTHESWTEPSAGVPARGSRRVGTKATWSFVYVFFSNGTPFDAPNRSEPCPRAR